MVSNDSESENKETVMLRSVLSRIQSSYYSSSSVTGQTSVYYSVQLTCISKNCIVW